MMKVTVTKAIRRRTVSAVLKASRVRLLLGFAVAALAVWDGATPISAHAAYESSSPAFAEVLDVSPSEITIRFTQELFRREGANEMWVEPARGDDIPLYQLQVEIRNDDRHVMRGSVDVELKPGRYLVSWRNLSAEDGDEDRGAFPFYIGSEPDASEVDYDREMAAALLIAYPGDAADQVDEPETVETSTAPIPTVVRSEQSSGGSLGVGSIVWLVAGGLAALLLVGALGWRLGSRRQST